MNLFLTATRKLMVIFVGALLTATLMITGVGAQSSEPACEGEYLESVRKTALTYIDVLNAGDLQPWIDLLADDYETYEIGSLVPVGIEGAIAGAEAVMEIFPGFQTEVHMSTVSTDCRFVTFMWTSTGIFGGPLGDIQPTGQETSVTGISITEVENGKIVREWVSYDQLTLFAKLGLVTLGSPAAEADQEASTEAVLGHHLQAIIAHDLDAVMSDYADDAVLFTPNGVFSGQEQIRAFFTEALNIFTPEVLSTLKFERQDINGEYVYLLWSAGETIPFATDTFYIRDGKIVMQSFAAQFGG